MPGPNRRRTSPTRSARPDTSGRDAPPRACPERKYVWQRANRPAISRTHTDLPRSSGKPPHPATAAERIRPTAECVHRPHRTTVLRGRKRHAAPPTAKPPATDRSRAPGPRRNLRRKGHRPGGEHRSLRYPPHGKSRTRHPLRPASRFAGCRRRPARTFLRRHPPYTATRAAIYRHQLPSNITYTAPNITQINEKIAVQPNRFRSAAAKPPCGGTNGISRRTGRSAVLPIRKHNAPDTGCRAARAAKHAGPPRDRYPKDDDA